MGLDEEDKREFEEFVRSIAEEVGRSVERAAERVDVDDLARTVGVDPDRAREWVGHAASWLREQAEHLGEDIASGPEPRADTPERGREASEPASEFFRGAAAHPLDLPTGEQGAALAGLESGRWIVEPGSHAFTTRGDGPSPSDALDLYRELRARDWITAEGHLTLAGRHALRRWLEASAARG